MISIIVPVYNVEPYLEQCLDSIIHQTYRDIEIIVVNDGSTDRSGEICRAYAGRDPRIVLFETENRGLSAARNLGIDNAHGEWIMFVDSDDWVEPEFCEAPLRAAQENDADLVIFDSVLFRGGTCINKKRIEINGFVSAEAAVEYGYPAVWNKLFKRLFFADICFPEGRRYEDLLTTYHLIYKAKRIIALECPLYYYRIRDGSITQATDQSLSRELYLCHIERYDNLLAYGYPRNKLDFEFFAHSLHYLMRTEPGEDPLYHLADETVNNYKGNLDGLTIQDKNAMKVWKINKKLFHNYCRIKSWTW